MLIVKIMSSENLPDDDPRKAHSLHDNVSNAHFYRQGDMAFCRMWVRDDVKTAAVPGFSEHEVNAEVPANAYVMNASGKTISTFCANPIEPGLPPERPAPSLTA